MKSLRERGSNGLVEGSTGIVMGVLEVRAIAPFKNGNVNDLLLPCAPPRAFYSGYGRRHLVLTVAARTARLGLLSLVSLA